MKRRDQTYRDQPSLFDHCVTAAIATPGPGVVQAAELQRVKSNIAIYVRSFFAHREGAWEFHASDLQQYVAGFTKVAPGSPERILREMRLAGELDYTVINRRQSLYRLEWIK